MANLVSDASAAAWIGVEVSDPFVSSLVTTASAMVLSYCGVATFDLVPAPVAQACLEVVAFLHSNRSNNPALASLSLGGGSVSFRSDAGSMSPLTATARVLLAPYVVHTFVTTGA